VYRTSGIRAGLYFAVFMAWFSVLSWVVRLRQLESSFCSLPRMRSSLSWRKRSGRAARWAPDTEAKESPMSPPILVGGLDVSVVAKEGV
jgi:hypothetical protein